MHNQRVIANARVDIFEVMQLLSNALPAFPDWIARMETRLLFVLDIGGRAMLLSISLDAAANHAATKRSTKLVLVYLAVLAQMHRLPFVPMGILVRSVLSVRRDTPNSVQASTRIKSNASNVPNPA